MNKNVTINPGRICQPLGAVMAFLGVRGAMPLIHGSQGCSTYMRFQITRHFREPVNIASSSLSEATVVYGGEKNLLKAIRTVEENYKPEVIAVISGCLSETIGDDINRIVRIYKADGDSWIIPVSTPGFKGSHVDGYDMAVTSILGSITENPSHQMERINLINGIMSPADTSELKSILESMGTEFLMITDTSESLDEPFDGNPYFITRHGTSISEIEGAANSMATLSLGGCRSGRLLEADTVLKIGLEIPAGLENTDRFIGTLRELFDVDISPSLMRNRGRLIDAMIDAHQYTYGRRVAIFTDPAYAVAITSMVLEMGMTPSVVLTGSESIYFNEKISQLQKEYGFRCIAMSGADIFDLQSYIAERPVDVLIGNSYCRRVAEEAGIPLMRVGFPVYDRLGSQRIRIAGYSGGIEFVDSISNLIIERYYEEGYEITDGGVADENSCCIR
ncbi:nitrogenase [Methanothermobacter thermautotrophicus]|uniref:Nitrogenase n=1 Tax=Methanothermobacter thermautotrophicus TaxID=145262 RepID=A0A842YMN5_METTF|nr:nitrogenase component 1 [Methanothermobacter thermautotrophicus]MBE2899870.1 nitrogenase [Methanothermobacter thermautotrophicus]